MRLLRSSRSLPGTTTSRRRHQTTSHCLRMTRQSWPTTALAMPDWYVNAARTLPPWNYAFQFPNPPQGERPPLISNNPIILMAATLVSVWSAAFAIV